MYPKTVPSILTSLFFVWFAGLIGFIYFGREFVALIGFLFQREVNPDWFGIGLLIWFGFGFLDPLLVYLLPVRCHMPGCNGRMRPTWVKVRSFLWSLGYRCTSCVAVYGTNFTFEFGGGSQW